MAGITANVVNGKLEYDYSDKKAESMAKGSNLGYDQFLQLLCAEMQYQDPLEPTSNTDYVAQLATFSQLEATLGMQTTSENSMANDLVGKQVILKVVNEATGNTKYVDGMVDYVLYQDGKTYLSVNNELHPISELDTVADSKYYDAMAANKTFSNMVNTLPIYANVTLDYKSMIDSVGEYFDNMTDYQKNLLNPSDVSTFKKIQERLHELEKAAEEAEKTAEEAEKTA